MRKVAYWALCVLLIAFGSAFAEPKTVSQTTYGPNSPNFNHISGPITYVAGTDPLLAQGITTVIGKLEQLNGSVSGRLRQLIVRGDFESAREAVAQAIAKSNGSISEIALLEYAQAVLLWTDRRPFDAEAAMRAAASLQPGNCTYLAFEGSLLVQLDRMTEAAFLVQESRPEVVSCMQMGRPFDRAVLNIVVAMVSRERRDETQTRYALESADAALGELALDETSDELEQRTSLACDFQRLAPTILGIDHESINLERSREACLHLTVRLGQDAEKLQQVWAEEMSKPWEAKGAKAAEQERLLSAAIDATESLHPHPNLGITEQVLQLHRAELLSNRGFLRLWQLEDEKGARADYELAYETLSPLLVTRNSEVWNTYSFLAGRMIHFNELGSTDQLRGGTAEVVSRNLRLLTRGASFGDTMPMCEVLYSLYGLARQLSPDANAEPALAIDHMHSECLSHIADRNTLRYQAELYHSAIIRADHAINRSDYVTADREMSSELTIAKNLYGFPLDIDRDTDWFEQIEFHAVVQQKLGRVEDAEQSYREVRALAKHTENDDEASTADMYLASLIEQTDRTHLGQAQQAVDESADLRLRNVKGESRKTCVAIRQYLQSLQLGSQISIERDDYPALVSHLRGLHEALDFIGGCTDVAPPYVSLEGGRVDAYLLDSFEIVGDGLAVEKALSDAPFHSVHEAAVSQREALARAMRPYDEHGIPRETMPLLNEMLSVAGTAPGAH